MAQSYDRRHTFVAKTASYTVTAADIGKTLTNRGDTDAITFTLPAVSSIYEGAEISFYCVADQDFAVAGTADELVYYNSAALTSVKFGTTSEKIGGEITAKCDGTSWLISVKGDEAQTVTVA